MDTEKQILINKHMKIKKLNPKVLSSVLVEAYLFCHVREGFDSGDLI